MKTRHGRLAWVTCLLFASTGMILAQDPAKLDCAIYLLDVAHTLERLADRTTNIAERVIFIATNVVEQLNA